MDASTASLSDEAAEQVESMRLDFEAHYRPVRGGHELEAVRREAGKHVVHDGIGAPDADSGAFGSRVTGAWCSDSRERRS